MYEVITVGSAIWDVMLKSSEFRVLKSHKISGGVALCEVYGGKSELSEMLMTSGGGATNVAASLVNWGVKVGVVAKVADDKLGKLIYEDMEAWGIGTELMVKSPEGQSGLSVGLIAADGGRSIMTYRGVGKGFSSAELPWDKLETKWLYISSLGGNTVLLEDLLVWASKQKVGVVFNPGRLEIEKKESWWNYLGKIDALIINRSEAAQLLGTEFAEKEKIEEGLAQCPCKYKVVTEGKDGAFAIECEGGVSRLVGIGRFKVRSVDDTGAGDAFGAGVVYGMVKGWPVEQWLKLAAANGANEVTGMGAKSGLLTDAKMKVWMKKRIEMWEKRIG